MGETRGKIETVRKGQYFHVLNVVYVIDGQKYHVHHRVLSGVKHPGVGEHVKVKFVKACPAVSWVKL